LVVRFHVRTSFRGIPQLPAFFHARTIRQYVTYAALTGRARSVEFFSLLQIETHLMIFLKPIALSLALCLASAALAQTPKAPAEERRHTSTDPLGEAQQRVEFARRAKVQAGDRVVTAENAARESEAEFQVAKKQFDQTAARREAARKALVEARSAAAAANKAYDKESAAFDRLRTTGNSGKAGR